MSISGPSIFSLTRKTNLKCVSRHLILKKLLCRDTCFDLYCLIRMRSFASSTDENRLRDVTAKGTLTNYVTQVIVRARAETL